MEISTHALALHSNTLTLSSADAQNSIAFVLSKALHQIDKEVSEQVRESLASLLKNHQETPNQHDNVDVRVNIELVPKSHRETGTPTKASSKVFKRFSQLIQKIEADPSISWGLECMASEMAMSRSKFAATFKQIYGMAPIEMVTDIRLQRAKALLLEGKPVGWVAMEVGYEDCSSLSRVFKKRFSVTPKQWLKHSSYPTVA